MRKVCYMCFLMLLLASCRSSTKFVCGQLFDSYGDTIACCMLITEPLSDTYTVVCDGYFEIEVPRYADSLVFESCCFGKHTLPIHPNMYIQFDYLQGEDSNHSGKKGWFPMTPCEIIGEGSRWMTNVYKKTYWQQPDDYDHFSRFCHRFNEAEVFSCGADMMVYTLDTTIKYMDAHPLLARRLFEFSAQDECLENVHDYLCLPDSSNKQYEYWRIPNSYYAPIALDSLNLPIFLKEEEPVVSVFDGAVDTIFVSELELIRRDWQKAIFASANERQYAPRTRMELHRLYHFYPYKGELIDHCTGNSIPWQQLGTTFEPILRMAELCPSACEIHFGIFMPDEMLQVGD